MDNLCTIVSKNYIALARTLAQSFLEHHPAGKVYVLLADEDEGMFQAPEATFEWVRLTEIGLPLWPDMRFQYDITEFNTAVKPYFLEYLLLRRGLESVVYADPDILVTHRMDDLYRRLPQYSIVLTPHILTPLPSDRHKPGEVELLQAGVYNLGFIALTRTDETLKMLRWWKDRLTSQCLMDPAQGYHVDQKWMDFVPALFEGVHILKDPAYNAAYWNLHERPIVWRNGMYEIYGSPLIFYHFSGLTPDLSRISKHQTRHQWTDAPDLHGLFKDYVSRLIASGYPATAGWRYTYNYFDNGIAIPAIVRKLYRKLGAPSHFGNPFHTLTPNGFYRWLFAPASSVSPMPNLLKEIYETRVDLQRLFPDPHGASRHGLMVWARQFVPIEYGMDPIVWHPVIDSMIYA
ncbi:hypothetical protein B1A99_32775 [Cohnella sp. CIP 111063]|uniref:hypothetical protein n=1 Tax=unclassified Cohnella TaxID=2636738 RepID=UPI000B8BDF29|nr:MULTISPECIES: hypothetical protein [unclassified Cohnella]OXS52791.1 hypothetical protein B1A99_32775 [Cohnella sp. CIP 111063]PRX59548.1 hypothetical protein B0G52_13187 [Cohnella sp. SGD-V74]